MQQGCVEINAGQHLLHFLFQLNAAGAGQVEYQGKNQCHQHDADNGRQFQEAVIDVTENGSRCQQQCKYVEELH